MQVAIIYLLLLSYMLYALFLSGKAIKKNCHFWSKAVIWGILVYSLNEGLRFGRGIDYNLYGQKYESFLMGGDFDYEIGFVTFARLLSFLGISWQGFVFIMSLIFILSSIYLLKNYKEVVPYALPLFALISLTRVENMVRWYLGFSFVLIGLSFLLQKGDKKIIKYSVLCIIACCFHWALAPICFLYLIIYIYKRNTIIFHPIVSIILFYCIAFFFQTSFMLGFIDLFNRYSLLLGGFSRYVDNADYWFTGGFAGAERNAFPGLSLQLLFLVVAYWGYKVVKRMDDKYIFAYNLFLIGYITTPIARQIELFSRYNATFYFFTSIIFACVIYKLFINKDIILGRMTYIFISLVFLNYGRSVISEPFKSNPDHYLYVWDGNGRTYDEMYNTWIDDLKYNN